MKNQLKDCTNQLLENLKKEKYTHHVYGVDLADIQLINGFNKGFRLLLCVLDMYSKYVWVAPLKDKRSTTITKPVK